MSKIVYKKTSDYENNSTTTTYDNSQINLDESVISIDNKNNDKNENWENNLNLINDINKEVNLNINKNSNDNINKNINKNSNSNDDINKNSNDNISNYQQLENFFSDTDQENKNILFFDKLANNDINTWLFIGMIVIGILIIIMILLTNNTK